MDAPHRMGKHPLRQERETMIQGKNQISCIFTMKYKMKVPL